MEQPILAAAQLSYKARVECDGVDPMARMQEWAAGDYFCIPLKDGAFSLGQVIATEPMTMKNAPACAFFGRRFEAKPDKLAVEPTDAEIVSVLFVTRDLLDLGEWQVVAHSEPLDVRRYLPDIDQQKAKEWVGTKVYGSGVARKLMNAYFGLHPWDGFYVSHYLDGLLLSPDRKPASVRLKRDFPEQP